MMHPPPHGGTTVKAGSSAQLEFVLDPSSGMLTAYVLDGMGMSHPAHHGQDHRAAR